MAVFEDKIRCLIVGQADGFVFFPVGELRELQGFERLFCFGVCFQVEGVLIDDADRETFKVKGVAVEHAFDGDGAGEGEDFVEVLYEFAHGLPNLKSKIDS